MVIIYYFIIRCAENWKINFD